MRTVLVLLLVVLLASSGCVRVLAHLGLGPGVSKRETAALQIGQFKLAIMSFYMHVGDLPRTLSELIEEPADKAIARAWDGPYLEMEAIPNDPWGHPYVYHRYEDNEELPYEIISFGADGKEGGTGADADISSTSLE